MTQTMYLISTKIGEHQTLAAIPLTKECPYLELIINPESKSLHVVHPSIKTEYRQFVKFNEAGEPLPNNNPKTRSLVPFKYEHRNVDVYYEYNLQKPEEIKSFLQLHVTNYEGLSDVIDSLLTV